MCFRNTKVEPREKVGGLVVLSFGDGDDVIGVDVADVVDRRFSETKKSKNSNSFTHFNSLLNILLTYTYFV